MELEEMNGGDEKSTVRIMADIEEMCRARAVYPAAAVPERAVW